MQKIFWQRIVRCFMYLEFIYSSVLLGQVAGPSVSIERSHPNASSEDRVGRTRHLLDLVFPVFESKSDLSVLFRGSYAKEKKHVDLSQWQGMSSDSVLSYGAVALPKLGDFTPIVALSRYEHTKYLVKGMSESILGIKYRWSLSLFGVSTKAETTLAYRTRTFPHKNRYLIFAEQSFLFENGFRLLLATSGIRLESFSLDQKWRFFLGYEGDDRIYPTTFAGREGWFIGTVKGPLIGLRRHLFSMLFAELSVGMQTENTELWSYNHQKLLSYDTGNQPWAMIKIGVWLNE